MKLYNSLTRQIEEFKPLDPQGKTVGIYTCGPTVYFYPHIGNWRTFLLGDLVVRTLSFMGYAPRYLMNITDVGHLTGDNQGDSSAGEDRLEKAALKEGKTAWDVAAYYTQNFLSGYEKLHLSWPLDHQFCKATDHIPEQIAMIQKIEEHGFTYSIGDGVYFDVGAYEKAGNAYGLMSNIHIDASQARIAENMSKKDPRDFALWKFSPKGEKRQMEWESPWGVGFPGWHIECSAMSTKYLGDQFDIHLGGEDHKSTHHPNEIAQSEASTGKKPFVAYWMHGAFLQVDGGRMGKSLGNAFTLEDIEQRGFDAMSLRYFYMTGHYRKPLNFTFEALESAQKTLQRLYSAVASYRAESDVTSMDATFVENRYYQAFKNALSEDLNMPQALAVLWEVVGDVKLSVSTKLALISSFDSVLGFDFIREPIEETIPEAILELVKQRDELRMQKKWTESDIVRAEVEKRGYMIKDSEHGAIVSKRI